eukprot:4254692-Amphidinium_carterae.1
MPCCFIIWKQANACCTWPGKHHSDQGMAILLHNLYVKFTTPFKLRTCKLRQEQAVVKVSVRCACVRVQSTWMQEGSKEEAAQHRTIRL